MIFKKIHASHLDLINLLIDLLNDPSRNPTDEYSIDIEKDGNITISMVKLNRIFNYNRKNFTLTPKKACVFLIKKYTHWLHAQIRKEV